MFEPLPKRCVCFFVFSFSIYDLYNKIGVWFLLCVFVGVHSVILYLLGHLLLSYSVFDRKVSTLLDLLIVYIMRRILCILK